MLLDIVSEQRLDVVAIGNKLILERRRSARLKLRRKTAAILAQFVKKFETGAIGEFDTERNN